MHHQYTIPPHALYHGRYGRFCCIVQCRSLLHIVTSQVAVTESAAEVVKGASEPAAATPSKAVAKAAADKPPTGTGKQQRGVGVIKRGAPDLKQKLQDAQAAEEAMGVLWTSSNAEAACGPAVQALQNVAFFCPGEFWFWPEKSVCRMSWQCCA